jgi:hypothetical protein
VTILIEAMGMTSRQCMFPGQARGGRSPLMNGLVMHRLVHGS